MRTTVFDSGALIRWSGGSQAMTTRLDNTEIPEPSLLLDEDQRLVQALKAGDEAAFMRIVSLYHPAMRRLALVYVADSAVADDVVQDAWIGMLQGIHRFEGRSSLKTWLFRILSNTAKTRAQRERRSVAFSNLGSADDDDEPAVEAERFQSSGPGAGHWLTKPESWQDLDERLASTETRRQIERVIETLPPNQRQVIILRDIEGWESLEVCNVLGLSESNQRVLLHRARSRVRRALEQFFTAA